MDGSLLDLLLPPAAGGHSKKAPEACCSSGFAYTGARGAPRTRPRVAKPHLWVDGSGVRRISPRLSWLPARAGTHCETNGVHHRCCADNGTWTCTAAAAVKAESKELLAGAAAAAASAQKLGEVAAKAAAAVAGAFGARGLGHI